MVSYALMLVSLDGDFVVNTPWSMPLRLWNIPSSHRPLYRLDERELEVPYPSFTFMR